jgi:hypothetical protein
VTYIYIYGDRYRIKFLVGSCKRIEWYLFHHENHITKCDIMQQHKNIQCMRYTCLSTVDTSVQIVLSMQVMWDSKSSVLFLRDDVSKPDAKKNSTMPLCNLHSVIIIQLENLQISFEATYTLLLLYNWKICRSHSKH